MGIRSEGPTEKRSGAGTYRRLRGPRRCPGCAAGRLRVPTACAAGVDKNPMRDIRGRASEPPASHANSLTKLGLAPSGALARHSDDLSLSPRLRLGVADHPPSAFGFVRVVSERGAGLVVRASVGGRG